MKKTHINLPINKIEFENTGNNSLSKAKIYVMHNKENDNDSFFEDEAIDKAENKIKNIPIISAIEKDENDNPEDFKGHEIEYKIVNEDGKIELKEIYVEQPIGVIPETNNYRIEEIDGYKWVVVDGLIFNNYCSDAIELLQKNNKKISMEIIVNDGEFNDGDKLYHIKDFEYLGVTILGDKYIPAMGDKAEISLYSSLSQNEKFTKIFQSMIKEVNKITKKEGGKMADKNKKPIKNNFTKEETGEIYIYGTIASESWWGDEITPDYIRNKLNELKDKKQINVYINSPGGDVFSGNTIANLFKRCNAQVNMFIDGIGASMGSVIPMAGDTINMYSNSIMMVHNPWTFAIGNSNELRKEADDMDKIRDTIIGLYMEKTKEGVTKEQIIDLMDKESWLTVDEAKELFDINVIEDNRKEFSVKKFSKESIKLFNKFNNMPKDLLDNININHEEKNESEDNKNNPEDFKKEYQDIVKSFKTLEDTVKGLEDKVETLTTENDSLKENNKELNEFKLEKETEERKNQVEQIRNKFDFSNEEISDLVGQAEKNEISLENFEEKLYAMTGKKLKEKYSAILEQKEDNNEILTTQIFSKTDTKDSCPYPSLKEYFNE